MCKNFGQTNSGDTLGKLSANYLELDIIKDIATDHIANYIRWGGSNNLASRFVTDSDITDEIVSFTFAIIDAYKSKLVEQEPVVTVSQETFSSDGTSDIITNNLPSGTKLYAHPMPVIEQEPVAYIYDDEVFGVDSGAINEYIRKEGQPLYAHPCVAPVSDKSTCDSQNGKYETQDENISGLLKALDNDLAVLGKTLDDFSSPNEALDAVVDWNIKLAMYPLINGGFQLVPIDPTEEMHHAARDWSIGKYGKAIGFEASHGCYKAMIEAAPKYKENINE